MITGYNTDVEHDGVIYHVQTEDKGIDSPILLSLVYSGGAILAAKRSPYVDLIEAGFDEAVLVERLKRQHQLICAAIHAGRIEALKQLSKPQTGRLTPEPSMPPADFEGKAEGIFPDLAVAEANIIEEQAETTEQVELPPAPSVKLVSSPIIPAASSERYTGSLAGSDRLAEETPAGPRSIGASPYTVYDSRRSRSEDVPKEPDGLRITLLGYDPDFRGGQEIQLKGIVTRVSAGVEEPLGGVAISVKILGTTFRPVLFSLKTDREGLLSVSTRIPPFVSGRAAIVVKAAAGDLATEARWVVHPGK